MKWLNSHPLPGRFTTISAEVTEQHIKQSMTRCWEKIVKGMKYAITRAPMKILSSKRYYFGKECVKMNSQTYRTVFILLIQLALFGDDFSKLMNYEIISKSKNMTIIHMSLQRRNKEIFTLAGLCAVDFIINKKHYTCCGKVNTEINGCHMISYIINECHETWIIQLANGETKQMRRLNYDNNIGCYVYLEEPKWRITQYWLF